MHVDAPSVEGCIHSEKVAHHLGVTESTTENSRILQFCPWFFQMTDVQLRERLLSSGHAVQADSLIDHSFITGIMVGIPFLIELDLLNACYYGLIN